MKYFFLLMSLFLIVGCESAYEEVEFQEIKNVRVKLLTADQVELTGDCVLYNPNLVGLDITKADFDVFVNDRKAVEIHQELDVEMPADTTFILPLKARMSPKEFYGEKGRGLLGAALQVLANEKVNIKYNGSVNAGIGAVNFKVPVVDSVAVPVKIFN